MRRVTTRGLLSANTVAFAIFALSAVPATATPGHLEGFVPSAAHEQGRFGSFWTTDIWIYQQGATAVHLWFNPRGSDNTNAESVVVSLDAPVVHLEDVVATLFGTDGVGSIHYLADGPVEVLARVWTTAEDGGSFGQTVPGVPVDLASAAGEGQANSLRMLADQVPGFRANLGIVNVTGVPVTVAVEIFTSDGQPAPGGSVSPVDLHPYGMTQINDLFDGLDPGVRRGLIVRATVSSEQGAVLTYLSTVDNTTNDASYQEGFRFGF